jgi:hypothetical protein
MIHDHMTSFPAVRGAENEHRTVGPESGICFGKNAGVGWVGRGLKPKNCRNSPAPTKKDFPTYEHFQRTLLSANLTDFYTL